MEFVYKVGVAGETYGGYNGSADVVYRPPPYQWRRFSGIVEARRLSSGKSVQKRCLYLGEINDSQQDRWRKTLKVFDETTSLGRAGIVLSLEVSRLARNSMDWHRLLEISALSDTLILDEDGVYDPAHFNDRPLLGLSREP